MKKTFLISVLLNLIAQFSFSQSEYVIEINRSNGVFTKTGPPIDDIMYIYPNDRAFDENTGTFFFPSSQPTHSLYGIKVSDGSIVHHPLIGSLYTFQFDNTSSMMYGLQQDNVNDVKNFVRINTATGVATKIGNSLPGSSLYSDNFSAYDEVHHTYFFLAPPNIFYAIDANNGAVLSSPALALANGESMINFSFDNSTGILYGLLQNYGLQKYYLAKVNPATGIITKIGQGTPFGAGSSSSTIDVANKQFIFMYSSATEGGYAITTLDMTTGNLLHHALIQAFTANDNFFSLKFDNVHGKLYSIHWETLTTGVSTESDLNTSISLFPNPTTSQATLHTDFPFKDATVTIFNALGLVVQELPHVYGEDISLERKGLPCGVYLLRVMQDHQVLATKKIVLE